MSFKLSEEEKAFLKALNKHHVRFMIVGLTSAVLQNSHVVTQDIDLWVDNLASQEFQAAVKDCGAFYVPAGLVGFNPPMLGPKSLDIFDLITNMHGLESFDKEYLSAIEAEISGVKVKLLPLERIIVSKEAANSEKDRAVLPALKATLEVK